MTRLRNGLASAGAASLCAFLALTIAAPPLAAQCQQAKLLAWDGLSNDNFAKSVAIEGAAAAMGSPNDDHAGNSAGSAYVFRRTGRTWGFEKKLTASQADANDLDHFGTALDLSSDVIAVGAPGDDEASVNAGAAYIFRRVAGLWTQQAKLSASDALSNSYFGRSIALEGNLLVVGAYLADTSLFDEGKAYVFRYDGSRWVEEGKLTASDGDLLDYFGYAVAVTGNIAVVGAYLQDDRGVDAGAVYVFRKSGAVWTQEATLLGSDTGAGDYFGQALDVEGTRIVVGAPGNNDSGPYTGSAYVFRYNGSQWVQDKKLLAPDGGTSQDIFGVAVVIEGGIIAVGEPGDDTIAGNAGVVYLYRHDGSTWVDAADVAPSDPEVGQLFGSHLDMDGAFLLTGAYGDNQFGSGAGAAYVDLYGSAIASWNNYGAGYPGTSGIPDLVVDADPVMGTTIHAQIDNSLGTSTFAILMIGLQSVSLPTNLDGTLLVLPDLIIPLQIPGPGMSLKLAIPCNDSLIGVPIYLQSILIDPGASNGAAFTPGLALTPGF